MTVSALFILAASWLHVPGGQPSRPSGDRIPQRSGDRPNVILFVADDLGWKDLGFMGSDYYETPHLDRLASEGMVFTQAYAGAANCAPSRACLMSGRNTPRHGIYTVGTSERGDARTRKLIPVRNTVVLEDSVYTLAEMFRDNGYATGIIGKWHLGEDPRTQGFSVNVAGSHRGSPGKGGYFSPYHLEFLEDGPEGEYLTDRLGEEAVGFLREHRDTSFFLYLPFYSVHTPIMGKEELVERFEGKPGAGGQDRPDYAAMVASVDENVGRVLRALENLRLSENTLVIFTSDNGGIRDISRQDPLRAGKGSYYEGGIRIPMVIRWPDRIAPGSRCDLPVTNLDLYPTLQAAIGAVQRSSLPDGEGSSFPLGGTTISPLLDGRDISPLLGGEQPPEFAERALFWHFPVYLQAYHPGEDDGRDPLFRTRPGSVVRQGKWKLHEYFEDGGRELYDLESDPGERRNLAGTHPGKVRELQALLDDWRAEMNAPVPSVPNPEYDAAFEKEALAEVEKKH